MEKAKHSMWLISKKNDVVPYQDSISLIDCGCELEGSFRFLETLLLRGKLKGMSIYADTLTRYGNRCSGG